MRMKRIQVTVGVAAVISALILTMTAQAIPLSVLREQEHQRVEIKFDVIEFGTGCRNNASPELKDKCDKIVVNIRSYISGIEANIDFCKRYEEGADPKERSDIEKAIKDYQRDIQWAREQLKSVAK